MYTGQYRNSGRDLIIVNMGTMGLLTELPWRLHDFQENALCMTDDEVRTQ